MNVVMKKEGTGEKDRAAEHGLRRAVADKGLRSVAVALRELCGMGVAVLVMCGAGVALMVTCLVCACTDDISLNLSGQSQFDEGELVEMPLAVNVATFSVSNTRGGGRRVRRTT